MNIIAKSCYIKFSPQKLRLITKIIKNKFVYKALEYLLYIPNKSSKILKKIINSAIANAEYNYGLDINDLIIYNIYVNEGPRFKKIMPRAKGRINFITKRTSHITLIVSNIKKNNKNLEIKNGSKSKS